MKRLLAVLFFIGIFLNYTAPATLAQTTSEQIIPEKIPNRINSDVPENSGTYTQLVLLEVIAAFTCQLTGVDPINSSSKCLGVDDKTGKIGFTNEDGGGAIGVVTGMITQTFYIPINANGFVSHTASNFGITKSAHAQTTQPAGYGFTSLTPLLNTWMAFRDLVYVLFVIFFMLIGIAIMFRFKIDARTVMTIQNAIPKAIITLVLITFSFAISGFLVDIMYFTMFLFYEIIASIPGVNVAGLNPNEIQGVTPFGAVGFFGGTDMVGSAASGLGHIIQSILEGSIAEKFLTVLFIGLTGGYGSAFVILDVLNLPGGFSGGDIVSMIGGVIAFFIFGAALLFALLRLWFLLLKAYLFILIDTVIAPIWIAGSLIPGSPMTAGSWFKHIFSYIAVFPVTLFMLLLGSVFVQQFAQSGTNFFTPPLIGNPIDPQYFGAIIGLAILLMTTEVVNMVKNTLKAPSISYQQAIGQGLSTGTAATKALPGMAIKKTFEIDKNGNPKGTGAKLWANEGAPKLHQFMGKIPAIGRARRRAEAEPPETT